MDILDGIINELMSVNSAAGQRKRRRCLLKSSSKRHKTFNYISIDTIRSSFTGKQVSKKDNRGIENIRMLCYSSGRPLLYAIMSQSSVC